VAEALLRFDGVSVRYRLRLDHRAALKDLLLLRQVAGSREHVALDGIDLEVARGEAVGIIGGNGAGKSTLLRVAARILDPTSGRVRIRGSVVPLLDLIGGFHPDLTGRENVALQMSLLGGSRRMIAERFDDIATFAGIGAFIDAPLRTYSAGMTLRLGFAVVIALDADLLLVDEALGVGDAAFQDKCAARIAELRANGAAFLIVSHDLLRLQELCDRILWLDRGRIRAQGDPHDVVRQYAEAVTR
jgi:lipopolysaccharide transport system ATP-binding protein